MRTSEKEGEIEKPPSGEDNGVEIRAVVSGNDIIPAPLSCYHFGGAYGHAVFTFNAN